MGSALAVVTFPNVNGIARDDFQTSFPIITAGAAGAAGNAADIAGAIAALYNTVATESGTSVAGSISSVVSRATDDIEVKVYDLAGREDGTPHGSPVASSFFTLAAQDGLPTQFPTEVACVLTTRATGWVDQPIERADGSDAGSEVDRPRQRYSGRNFIGPLNANALGIVSPGQVMVHANFRLALLHGAEDMQDNLVANGHSWAVWSRKDAVLRPIEGVSVDNAFDTQRRRGPRASARESLTIG